jgi:hypothetical protein
MEKTYEKILVVGATSRNLGKTNMVCALISRFSNYPITAIKIKTLRPGDQQFHGTDPDPDVRFIIRNESELAGRDDTVRLLKAGAAQVLYIKCPRENLAEAFAGAATMIPPGNMVIIESNSIREIIRPAIYLLIMGAEPSLYKPSAIETAVYADITITTDGSSYSVPPERLPIRISGNAWKTIRL